MKQVTRKYFSFIGRSMLWSLLLYGAMMLVINWEEVANTMSGRNAVTIVSHTLPYPSSSSLQGGSPAHISAVHDGAGALMTLLHVVSELLPH